MNKCEREPPPLSRGLMGLSASELGALAAQGAYQLSERNMLDWTSDKVSGLVRHILTSVGGALVLLGYMDESMVQQLVAASMMILGFVWSWKAK